MISQLEPTAGDLGHKEKVLLYTMSVLEDLKAKGLIEGGKVQISDKGRAIINRLKAEGFRPTDAEINSALAQMMDAGQIK